MADNTPIEWTDATWNPVTGCKVVSPGCTNCYAMKLAGTRMRNHPSRAGLTVPSKAGPVWNGLFRFNEPWLDQPLRWRRPRRIFVCAHGDLFFEHIPDDDIDRIFAVMALCPQHIFQVLTKRPERMREYTHRLARSVEPLEKIARDMGHTFNWRGHPLLPWPIPNIWLGTSVEDQQRADERVPLLLDTPAALRFVSYEPALGPVDFTRINLGKKVTNGYGPRRIEWDALTGWESQFNPDQPPGCDMNKVRCQSSNPHRRLDWIIVGGESGAHARPFDTGWARTIIRQCREASVPVFVKQVGSKPIERRYRAPSWPPFPLGDKKGGDPAEWPADLRVREFPQLKEQSDDQAPR